MNKKAQADKIILVILVIVLILWLMYLVLIKGRVLG